MRMFAHAIALGLIGFSASAQAGTVSGTVEVSLEVLPACRVTTAPLAFSATQGSGATAQTPVEVTCTSDTDVAVALDAGRHSVGSQPRLAGGDGTLVPYAVYSDPAHLLAWTRRALAAQVEAAQPLALVAYGRIDPSASLVPTGDYRDTLTVTVSF